MKLCAIIILWGMMYLFYLAGPAPEAAPRIVTTQGQSLVPSLAPSLALGTGTVPGQAPVPGRDLLRTIAIRAAVRAGLAVAASLLSRTEQTGAVAGLETSRTMEKRFLPLTRTRSMNPALVSLARVVGPRSRLFLPGKMKTCILLVHLLPEMMLMSDPKDR